VCFFVKFTNNLIPFFPPTDIPFYCLMFFCSLLQFLQHKSKLSSIRSICRLGRDLVNTPPPPHTHFHPPQCKITHPIDTPTQLLCMCTAHLLVSIFMLGYTNAVETISLISFPSICCFLFCPDQPSRYLLFLLVCQSNGKKQNPRKKHPELCSDPFYTEYTLTLNLFASVMKRKFAGWHMLGKRN